MSDRNTTPTLVRTLQALAFLLAVGGASLAFSDPAIAAPQVRAGTTGQAIKLDGLLDEPAWEQAGVIPDLIQQDPHPGEPTPFTTEIRVLVTASDIVFGIICHDPDPDGIAIHTMQRDGEMGGDDFVSLILDPMNDKRRGYYFRVNAAGARLDGLVAGSRELSIDWDGIWDSATRRTATGWSVEIRIPAQTLRFPWGQDQWGMNVGRYIPRVQTGLRWSGISLDANFTDLQRAGTLNGMSDLRPGRGISFSPFGLVGADRDYSTNEGSNNVEVGGDLTWNINSDLSAILTINPDFAETEVDTRQANLTRFPLFFPEKRPFFLEGSEMFNFGPGLRDDFIPFFSRRIGLFDGQMIGLPVGLKLLGNSGPWQLAGLAVGAEQSELTDETQLFAGRVNYDFSENLTVGAIATSGDPEGKRDNTLVGMDIYWRTSQFRGDKNLSIGGWTAASYGDVPNGNNVGWGVSAEYPNDLWDLSATVKEFGENLDPALGFLPRPGTRWYQGGATFKPRPQGESLAWVRQFYFEFYPRLIQDANGDVESWRIFAAPLHVRTQSGERIEANFVPQFERLVEPFEITDGVVIPAGEYHYSRYRIEVESAEYRPWQLGGTVWFGGFFDGTLTEAKAFAKYTTPAGNLQVELAIEQNRGNLAGGHFNINIAQFKVVYAFTPDMVLSSNIQYDSESQDMGANSRFRWTIKPGTDLFIVWNRGWQRPFDSKDPFGMETVSDEIAAKLRWTFRM